MRQARMLVLGLGSMTMVAMSPLHVRAQATPPDSVELVGGGLVRGTIVEHLPGEHVIIQLVTGELRRFTADQVLRVVSTSSAPQPAPTGVAAPATDPPPRARPQPSPSPPAPPSTVRLYIDTDHPGLMLHRVVGISALRGGGVADHYEQVCAPPCETELRPGRYFFAYSEGRAAPRLFLNSPIDVTPRMMLHVIEEDRGAERTAGAWVLTTSLGVAAVLGAATALHAGLTSFEAEISVGLGIAAASVFTIGLVVALYLIERHDHIDLRVRPLSF